MAEEYDNNNSGLIFASDADWIKQNPKRPSLKGTVEVDHKQYEVAIFDLHKSSKKGNRMFSVKFTPVQAPNADAPQPAEAPAEAGVAADPDNLPF